MIQPVKMSTLANAPKRMGYVKVRQINSELGNVPVDLVYKDNGKGFAEFVRAKATIVSGNVTTRCTWYPSALHPENGDSKLFKMVSKSYDSNGKIASVLDTEAYVPSQYVEDKYCFSADYPGTLYQRVLDTSMTYDSNNRDLMVRHNLSKV